MESNNIANNYKVYIVNNVINLTIGLKNLEQNISLQKKYVNTKYKNITFNINNQALLSIDNFYPKGVSFKKLY